MPRAAGKGVEAYPRHLDMAMLRRLFFCCFPSEHSLQEPGFDSIVTNAVLSVQEQSREFLNPAGTAAASASVADANAAVPLEGKTEAPDRPLPAASNVSGASSPGSASKAAPGTPPLDTQGFSESSGIFDEATAAAKAMSGTASELLEEAESWAEKAAAGMASFTTESRSFLDKIGHSETTMAETVQAAEADTKDDAAEALHQAESSAAATYSAVDNVRASAAEAVAKAESEATASAQAAGSGKLPQAEESAAAALAAVNSAGTAAVDAVSNAESKVVAAAKSVEQDGISAAEEALAQVDMAETALQSEMTKTKATLAAVVDPDGMPEASQSADEETADAGGSDQSGEEVPGGVDNAAGAGGGAKKPKKKNAKKKSGKKKGKSSKSK